MALLIKVDDFSRLIDSQRRYLYWPLKDLDSFNDSIASYPYVFYMREPEHVETRNQLLFDIRKLVDRRLVGNVIVAYDKIIGQLPALDSEYIGYIEYIVFFFEEASDALAFRFEYADKLEEVKNGKYWSNEIV